MDFFHIMKQVNSNLTKGLICLNCNSALGNALYSDHLLVCKHCQHQYPVVNNIPIIIDESNSIFKFKDFTCHTKLFFGISDKGKWKGRLGKILPSLAGNNLRSKKYDLLRSLRIQERRISQVLIL